MPGAPTRTMTSAELQKLADRLISSGNTRNLVEQIAELQAECRLAARVIRTLLRHVSPTDVFAVYGEDGK
jgi:hypothetical protein